MLETCPYSSPLPLSRLRGRGAGGEVEVGDAVQVGQGGVKLGEGSTQVRGRAVEGGRAIGLQQQRGDAWPAPEIAEEIGEAPHDVDRALDTDPVGQGAEVMSADGVREAAGL